MRTMTKSVALATALIAAGAAAPAQTTAHQGAPDPHVFHSPMVLETPLPDLTKLRPGQGMAVSSDVPQYVCDDASLGAIRVEALAPSRRESGKRVLEFSDTVHVAKSHDRLIDITMAVKHGETVLARGSAKSLSVEEEDTRPFRVRVVMDSSEVAQAYASEPRPSLEITVVVRDNN
jgi:hypothetical protein